MGHMGKGAMDNPILTSPYALLISLLSLPLLVAASVAAVPESPWASVTLPLRVTAVVAVCLATAVVVARFLVMGS